MCLPIARCRSTRQSAKVCLVTYGNSVLLLVDRPSAGDELLGWEWDMTRIESEFGDTPAAGVVLSKRPVV
jgi:hypothetical protein